MKKSYILVVLIITCFLFTSCNEKQVTDKNTKQTVLEDKKEEIKTDTTAIDSEKSTADNKEDTSKEQITYNLYGNPRYGFSIEYPSNLKERKVSDNGDGVILSSSQDNIELTVYGSNNILNETAQSELNSILNEHPDAPYKKQEGNWFVASWIEEDRIVYYKSVVGEGSSNTFIYKYPTSKKEYYDPIVTRINSSFNTPGVSKAH